MTIVRPSSSGKGLLQLIKEGIERDLKPLGIENKTIAEKPTIYLPKQGISGEPIEEPEEVGGEQLRKPTERDWLSAFFDHDEEMWEHV